jgi:peptidoglycan/LPS O-acetylase OafA/YrhL
MIVTKGELDGLRGIAIIIVFLGHILLFQPEFGEGIGSFGQVGVYLFFVLSAYLLTSITLNELKKHKLNKVLKSFLVRRILRIFPMYYFSLSLILYFPIFSNMMFGGREFDWLNHFFLRYPEGNYWAISVEVQFYLLIPIISLLILKSRRMISQILVCLFFLILSIFLSDWIKDIFTFAPNFPHLPPYVSIFLFGVLVAQIQNTFPVFLAKIPWVFWQIIFLLGFIMYLFLIPRIGISMLSAEGIYAQHYSLVASFASFLILLSALNWSSGIVKILLFAPLRYIGVISFSIYLLHIYVMSYYAGKFYVTFGIYICTLLIFVMVTILASLTYLIIERPFIRIGQRITRNVLN